MKLGFIGYGNMASAIVKGLVSFNVIKNTDIYACARNYDKLKTNCSKLGINACQDSTSLITKSDIVVLAVKPYQIASVIEPVKDLLSNKIVISIAAGVYFEDYEKLLNENTPHLSTVPNTPISTGKGIMICEEKHSLNKEQLDLFKEIFGKIALLEFVDTEHFSIAGTLSGCTPAFTAMYLEALSDAGVKYGLTRESSYRLAAKMIEGVGALYLENKEHPGIMKDAVCSPGGTTIKGVSALEKTGFRGSVISAIDAIEKKD